MVKVAINGFGRIGRNTFRAAVRNGSFERLDYVAINDPGLTAEEAAHLLKYDSVMGRFEGTVSYDAEGIIVNGKKSFIIHGKRPFSSSLAKLGVEVVIESTGFFTDAEKAKAHITAGAKKVLFPLQLKMKTLQSL